MGGCVEGRRGEAGTFGAHEQRDARREARDHVVERRRAHGVRASTREAQGAHGVEAGGPGCDPAEGDAEHVADRHADGAPIKRIAGSRVEEHRAGAQAGGVAEQGTEVLVVVDAFDASTRRSRPPPSPRGRRVRDGAEPARGRPGAPGSRRCGRIPAGRRCTRAPRPALPSPRRRPAALLSPAAAAATRGASRSRAAGGQPGRPRRRTRRALLRCVAAGPASVRSR